MRYFRNSGRPAAGRASSQKKAARKKSAKVETNIGFGLRGRRPTPRGDEQTADGSCTL